MKDELSGQMMKIDFIKSKNIQLFKRQSKGKQ